MKTALFLFLLLLRASFLAAAPPDPSQYIQISGGPVFIPDRSIVQGSHEFGGIQPDYLIDSSSEIFLNKQVKAKITRLKGEKRNLIHQHKIESIQKFIKKRLFPSKYFKHINFNKSIHEVDPEKRVPLSTYFGIHSGVCREFALTTHLLLNHIEIPNQFIYAEVSHFSRRLGGSWATEDHGFDLYMEKGELWIVDTYDASLDGYRFVDILAGFKDTVVTYHEKSRKSWGISPGVMNFRMIEKVNVFPTVWVPKDQKEQIRKPYFDSKKLNLLLRKIDHEQGRIAGSMVSRESQYLSSFKELEAALQAIE